VGVLVDEKLNTTQQCALAAQKVSHILGYIKKGMDNRLREVYSAPLLCSGVTPLGVLRPPLEPSALERHGPVGAGPEEGYKHDPRGGAPLL